jgi:hypothetical protein
MRVTSIQIMTTAKHSTINAIETLVRAIDPQASISYYDPRIDIIEKDADNLREALMQVLLGEMDFCSFDEVKNRSSKAPENIRPESAQVVFTANFENLLNNALTTIAEESTEKAAEFQKELLEKISSIPSDPFRYRMNQVLGCGDISDLIFQGYIIPFKFRYKHLVEILGIYKGDRHRIKIREELK